jgi:type II restriction enzyme
MARAILEDRTPNLLALHYDPALWRVRSLILIPRFAFSLSALKKRKPLGPKAERAGWVGCNILLGNIPPDARIGIVTGGTPSTPTEVRRQYAKLKPLVKLTVERRGWTLDVLNVVRALGKQEFSLSDVYACERDLSRLHPANRHVQDKIRQQLQILRDLGFVEFLGAGDYRVR